MKALNKTHIGHSRYIDINDPTGTGKSVNFQTGWHINTSSINNQMRDIRMIRREWNGTKYIN